MKAWFRYTHTFAVAAVGCLLAVAAHAQTIQVNKDNRTIAITTTDSATGMADTATVHLGFVTYAPDAPTAYAKGSETSNAIVKALMDAGVARTALQSDTQSLAETPPYQLEKLPPAQQTQRTYRLQQSWTAQTKADSAAKVLNAAVNAGANQSGEIDWTVTDEDALLARAAGKALTRAHIVAEQMAQGLGIKLGSLIYASNQPAEARSTMMRNNLVGLGTMGGSATEKPHTAPLSIQPHKVERSATVYAVFAIE